ncbi:MAG: hypothetical protein ACTTKH_05900 [Treponema sp.]
MKEGNNTLAKGSKVEKGKSITFTISDLKDGYTVKEWKNGSNKIAEKVNDVTVVANTDVNVVVELEKILGKVNFDAPIVISKPKTGNKIQDVKLNVTYPNFELFMQKKYIDAIITRADGKDFPVGAKFRIKYEYTSKDGVTGQPILSSSYTVASGTKRIFASQLFKNSLKHTELNASHIECKEKYTISLELPKEQLKDIEIDVVSALFATENAEESESILGKINFTIKGVKKIESVTFRDLKVENTGSEKAVRKVSFNVEYPSDFNGETGEFIDSILSLKDDKPFPNGTQISMKYVFNRDITFPLLPYTYTIPNENTKKIYVQRKLLSAMEGKHPQLDSIFAHERYEFTITLPEEAKNDVYEVNVECALFNTGDAEDIKQSLGKTKFEIKGYGK